MRGGGLRVGIASVYRALEGMDRGGLVQRIDLGDGVARFEPVLPGGEHRRQLATTAEGRAVRDPALEVALERIAGGRGYEVEAHDVVLRGACGECQT